MISIGVVVGALHTFPAPRCTNVLGNYVSKLSLKKSKQAKTKTQGAPNQEKKKRKPKKSHVDTSGFFLIDEDNIRRGRKGSLVFW